MITRGFDLKTRENVSSRVTESFYIICENYDFSSNRKGIRKT